MTVPPLYDCALGRVAAEPRALLYRAAGVCVDILVHEAGNGMRIVYGQLVHNPDGHPLAGLRVTVGTDHVETDAHGEFALTFADGRAPQQFRVAGPDGEILCAVPELQMG